MTESRGKFPHYTAVQLASLSTLPFWYPFYAKSLFQRTQILNSKLPGDLSHSAFFRNKKNYYRGLTSTLPLQPLFPISEWLLEVTLNKLAEVNKRDPNLADKIAAGFITGCATALVSNPCEVITIALQNNTEKPTKAFMNILSNSGPTGFYTGIIPMALRNGTFVSGIFITTKELKERIDFHFPGTGTPHKIGTMALGSLIPATIFTCVTAPSEISAVMRQSDPSKQLYKSIVPSIEAL